MLCRMGCSLGITQAINPLRPNLNFTRVDPDSSNSPRLILVDEATIHGNNNCAVGNKDSGMFSHDLKLSWARLDEEDRNTGTYVVACSELVCTTTRRLLQVGNDVKQL